MSFANYIQPQENGKSKEIDFGNIELDTEHIECESIIVNDSLIAPQLDEITTDIQNIKLDIEAMKADLEIFKSNIVLQFAKITNALAIDSENKRITTTYNLDITGDLSHG